jgi:hypothetical protein
MKAKVVRHLKADEDVEAKVRLLATLAIQHTNKNQEPAAPESDSPAVGLEKREKTAPAAAAALRSVAARCGHRALRLHYGNGLRTRRLLSRQDERSLCPYCGASLEQVPAQVLKGKALRSVRKHLRSRRSKGKGRSGGAPILLKGTYKNCSLCGETVIHKTFKKKEGSSVTNPQQIPSPLSANAGGASKQRGRGEKETRSKSSSTSRLQDLSKQH